MNTSRYTVVDLFSGAGGFLLGFLKAGFNPLLSTDFDKDCADVHKTNLSHVPFLQTDIYDLSESVLSKYVTQSVDVLIGGPPCQGFSTIGARASSNADIRNRFDMRNTLFRQYIRVLRFLKPKVFLMENVKGILTKDKGRVLDEIKKEFNKTGYSLQIFVLNAADYGVPQIRERVFFFGSRIDIPLTPPTATHGESLEPYSTVLNAIGDLADKSSEIPNHEALKHGEINIRRYKLIPEGGRMPEDKLPPELYRKNFGNTFKRLHRNKPSLTMVPGHNAFPIHPWLDRSLTVREAARIQTFPDNYIFCGSRQKQCMQVGNAVPVQLSYAWAMHISKLLDNSI